MPISSTAARFTHRFPVPMPSSNRSSVSTARLCASHAAVRGGRTVLASTNVPTRSVEVTAAATATAGSGASSCSPSGISNVE